MLWTNRLINSKITNKTNRKRYKKYFNKEMGNFFAPLFLIVVIISTMIEPGDGEFKGLYLFAFILKIILLIVQVVYSTMVFIELKENVINLLTKTEDEAMADIPKKV